MLPPAAYLWPVRTKVVTFDKGLLRGRGGKEMSEDQLWPYYQGVVAIANLIMIDKEIIKRIIFCNLILINYA